MAILSFKDARLSAIHNRLHPGKGLPADLVRAVQRKLRYLDAATGLDALRAPPGNRLHALKDDRAGQHAISVNDQFRICFVWTSAGPSEVSSRTTTRALPNQVGSTFSGGEALQI